MTKIITLAGRKGGITKTTLTVNLAAALAMRGNSVIVIETDGQGSSSRMLGLKPYDGFYALVKEDMEFQDVLVRVPEKFAGADSNMMFLGSSDSQQQIEDDPAIAQVIYDRFQELRGAADFVLVDTSPDANEINSAFFYVSDYLLLPTLCERPSLDMLQSNTLRYIENTRLLAKQHKLPCADVLGIVPNRFDARASGSRVAVGFLQGRYGERYRIFDIIRDTAVWGKAAYERISVPMMTESSDYNTIRQARTAIQELMPIVHAIEATAEPKAVSA